MGLFFSSELQWEILLSLVLNILCNCKDVLQTSRQWLII